MTPTQAHHLKSLAVEVLEFSAEFAAMARRADETIAAAVVDDVESPAPFTVVCLSTAPGEAREVRYVVAPSPAAAAALAMAPEIEGNHSFRVVAIFPGHAPCHLKP